MARKTHFEKDQIIARLADEAAALRAQVAQLQGDLEIAKRAAAKLAGTPVKVAPGDDCARCGGSGEYGDLGTCLLCKGSGVQPTRDEARADFRARRGAPSASREQAATMREMAQRYCAAHGVSSCTPDQVRAWASRQ